jgi:protein transport protein SEC24
MPDERTKIAFISYDKNVHFYNMKPILKQPQMMVITDTENVFLPQPEDFLVNLAESYDLVISFLDNLPNYFANTKDQDSAFIAALQCSNNIIKHIGGKMVFFQVSTTILRHPKLQGPAGKDIKQGMERLDLWQSSNQFFKNTGTELAHGQISFDLFDFSFGVKKGYKNIKTFSDISGRSSGNFYYYPEFNAYT